MSTLRGWILTAAVSIGAVSPAMAGFGERLFQGLDFLATPGGSPAFVNAVGQRINGNRVGRVRAVPNDVGGGYRIEFDRTFGLDALGRPEVLDFGPFELELAGNLQATAGYTTRGFLGGNLDFTASNLQYSVRGQTGVQDFDLSGTLNAAAQVDLNQFGFYTFNVEVNNLNSQLSMDGVVVDGDLDSDFDIGPVTLKGNLFFDVALAALASFGVDTSGLSGLFPSSPIDRITQQIQDRLIAQSQVLGLQLEADGASDPLLARLRTDGLGVFGAGDLGGSAVPEPTSLILILAGAGLAMRRR